MLVKTKASAGVSELEAPKYKCEASIMESLGAEPPAGPRGIASSQRGEALLKLKHLAFGRSLKVAYLKREKSDTICVVFSKK